MQLVEVVWDDACFEDEYGERDAPNLELSRLRTVGYLTAETDECVVLAMTICDEDKSIVTEQILIPWDMIVEWSDV